MKRLIKRDGQKTVIQELEMLALLVAVSLWPPICRGSRVVAFRDSESVRGSLLKTWSVNEPCSALLNKIFLEEETQLGSIWIEPVPSQSNPADLLPREEVLFFWCVENTYSPQVSLGSRRPSQGVRARRRGDNRRIDPIEKVLNETCCD